MLSIYITLCFYYFLLHTSCVLFQALSETYSDCKFLKVNVDSADVSDTRSILLFYFVNKIIINVLLYSIFGFIIRYVAFALALQNC